MTLPAGAAALSPAARLDLSGRVALVTGAGRGIGRAVARVLAALGAHVVANDVSPPDRVDGLGERVVAFRSDVSKTTEVAAMFAFVEQSYGRLDVLVNNAGIFPRAELADLDEQLWDDVLDTNLKGAYLCARHAAALMVPARHGRIVNVASSAAFTGSVRGAHYAASKAGLLGLTKSLARALAPYGVTVNAVAPGTTTTDQPGLDEAGFRREAETIPLRRVAQPEDVADVVAALAGDLCRYVTGQTISVNGGAVMP